MKWKKLKAAFLIINVIIGFLIYSFLVLGSIFPSLKYISLWTLINNRIFQVYLIFLSLSLIIHLPEIIRYTPDFREIVRCLEKSFAALNFVIGVLILGFHILDFTLGPYFFNERLFRFYLILLSISIIMHTPNIFRKDPETFKNFKILALIIFTVIVTYFTYLILNPAVYETFIGFVEFIIAAIFVFGGVEWYTDQLKMNSEKCSRCFVED